MSPVTRNLVHVRLHCLSSVLVLCLCRRTLCNASRWPYWRDLSIDLLTHPSASQWSRSVINSIAFIVDFVAACCIATAVVDVASVDRAAAAAGQRQRERERWSIGVFVCVAPSSKISCFACVSASRQIAGAAVE